MKLTYFVDIVGTDHIIFYIDITIASAWPVLRGYRQGQWKNK